MTEHRSEYRSPSAITEPEERAGLQRHAAEERERLCLAYSLMERVFLHVSIVQRTQAMELLRQMHNTISDRFNWPPLGNTRGD